MLIKLLKFNKVMFFFKTKLKLTQKNIEKLSIEVGENFQLVIEKNEENLKKVNSGEANPMEFFGRQPELQQKPLGKLFAEFLHMNEDFIRLSERFRHDKNKIEQIYIDFYNYLMIYKNAFSKMALGCPLNIAVEKITKDEIVRRFNILKN
jgi:hypothetical protein